MEKPPRRQVIAALASGLMCATLLSQIPKPIFASAPPRVTPSANYIDFPSLSSLTPSTGRLASEYDAGGIITNLVYSQDNANIRYLRTEQSASYVIFIDTTDSNKIKARNGTSGKIDYAGSDAATIINNAISALTNGGKILIKAGTYPIICDSNNGGIQLSGTNNIDLCGEGPATIFQLAANASTTGTSGCVIYGQNANHIRIHDLTVDGNGANQNPTNESAVGIIMTSCTDIQIYNCYSHDNVTYNFELNLCTDGIISNCYSFNGYSSGIVIQQSVRCGVINSISDSNSDYGIALAGTGGGISNSCYSIGNQVYNSTTNKSCFGTNNHHGIGLIDGTITNFTVTECLVDTTTAHGIHMSPATSADDIIIANNNLKSIGTIGIRGYAPAGTGMIIAGNIINGGTNALEIDQGIDVTVHDNVCRDFTSTAIYTSTCTSLSILNNLFSSTASVNGIYNDSGSTNINIGNNTLTLGSTPTPLTDNCLSTRIHDNIGINPMNKLTNAINNSNSTIGTNGNTAAVVASTTYTAQGPPALLVTSTGGTGVNITTKDGAGNTVQSGLPRIAALYLPYGFKINFGNFSIAPAVSVFGL